MQTAAADSAGSHVDVVQAMVTTAWNLAIASGGYGYSFIARERRTVHGDRTAVLDTLILGELMTAQQAPRLETERLILKQFTLDDFPALMACWSTSEMAKINGGGEPTAEIVWARLLRYIGHWHALGYGYWAVFEKTTGRYAGSLGFQDAHRDITPELKYPEAGWVLNPEVRGKGYASEALTAVLLWADQTFSSPVCCIIDEENKRSNYLAERFGFQFQDYVNYRGKQVRMLVRQ